MSSLAVFVIFSAYNNFQALTPALPFWQAQTQPGFELIIADDGSAPAVFSVGVLYFRENPACFLAFKELLTERA